MTPIECARALAQFLRERFEESKFRPSDEKTAQNGITIRDGFLPKRASAQEKAALDPCIVIRPVEVTDDANGSTIKLQLLALSYSGDPDNGHLELYHILEFARREIETNPLLDCRFELQMPVHTLIPEEQPFPEWWAYMELSYSIGQPGFSFSTNTAQGW